MAAVSPDNEAPVARRTRQPSLQSNYSDSLPLVPRKIAKKSEKEREVVLISRRSNPDSMTDGSLVQMLPIDDEKLKAIIQDQVQNNVNFAVLTMGHSKISESDKQKEEEGRVGLPTVILPSFNRKKKKKKNDDSEEIQSQTTFTRIDRYVKESPKPRMKESIRKLFSTAVQKKKKIIFNEQASELTLVFDARRKSHRHHPFTPVATFKQFSQTCKSFSDH
ncbi:hypothetical protein L1887_13343 [Cichorium endivia]|nr:hypothetical protein L1887_13343 [Cichorium endivia]